MSTPITTHCVAVQGRQVHYRHTGHGPAVLLLHASPRSSAALLPLMAQAPPGVSLYALDTPGFGLSDPLPQRRPEIADFGQALAQTLDALGIARAACYATHTGAAIALALAVQAPQRVSRLVIDGIGAFDAAERAMILHSYLPEFGPRADGSHMTALWSRTRDQFLFFPWNHHGSGARRWLPLPDAATLHAVALDLLQASDYRSAYAAAFSTDAAAWVAQLRVPALIGARPTDMLLPHLQRLGQPPTGVRIAHLPADPAACDALLWRELTSGIQAEAAAPAPVDAPLPAGATRRIADTCAGPATQRLHLRGRLGAGAARPLLLLHPSPGGPRSLDDALLASAHDGPAMAPSLPGHGQSSTTANATNTTTSATPSATTTTAADLLDQFEAQLLAAGLGDADLQGSGLGATLAAALAARRPGAWRCTQPALTGIGAAPVPGWLAPRDDGGQLFAAWQASRDDAILGPWWQRPAQHDFGDSLDLAAIQRCAVERLKETPEAAAWRLQASGASDHRC